MPTESPSNDHISLTPNTDIRGETLTFDFPGLLIGVAEYSEGPTGCTVFRFPNGAATAIDARGGLVGKSGDYEFCSAICFAGGSLMGLEAASGVVAGIFAQRDYSPWGALPLVNSAIIFDYGGRANSIYPDKALGRAALETARSGWFPVGAHGAGCNAHVGGIFDRKRSEKSGQGAAYREVNGVKIAIFTVVNALGVIVDRSGQVVRGNLEKRTNQRANVLTTLEQHLTKKQPVQRPLTNTTLTVLVTNAKLSHDDLTQLGRQVHSSMARAIQPFHTLLDGDVFYTVSLATVKTSLSVAALGLISAELAWDAILSATIY